MMSAIKETKYESAQYQQCINLYLRPLHAWAVNQGWGWMYTILMTMKIMQHNFSKIVLCTKFMFMPICKHPRHNAFTEQCWLLYATNLSNYKGL